MSSFLQIVGAANSYMDFESVRVVKDMRNRVNRQVNCETANLQKSVDAAVRQMRDVEKLLQYKRLSELSPSIRAPPAKRDEKSGRFHGGIGGSMRHHQVGTLPSVP